MIKKITIGTALCFIATSLMAMNATPVEMVNAIQQADRQLDKKEGRRLFTVIKKITCENALQDAANKCVKNLNESMNSMNRALTAKDARKAYYSLQPLVEATSKLFEFTWLDTPLEQEKQWLIYFQCLANKLEPSEEKRNIILNLSRLTRRCRQELIDHNIIKDSPFCGLCRLTLNIKMAQQESCLKCKYNQRLKVRRRSKIVPI